MSAKCPKCQTPLEDADFGIKICVKSECGAMLFVDFDGQVQLSGTEPDEAPRAPAEEKRGHTESVPMMRVHSHLDSASSSKEETYPHSIPGDDDSESQSSADDERSASLASENVDSQSSNSGIPGFDDVDYGEENNQEVESAIAAEPPRIQKQKSQSTEPPSWMVSDSSNEETMAQGAMIPPPPADLVAASEAEAAAEEEAQTSHRSLDESEWFDQPLDHGFTTPEKMNVSSDNSGMVDFSDVVDFANSSELDNSPLVYTMWIEGIDHRDIRSRVEDVLSDSRLNFHLSDVMKPLKQGVLEIRDLNPVKASFIASKLRAEAVNFRWKQAIFGTEASHGEGESAESFEGSDMTVAASYNEGGGAA